MLHGHEINERKTITFRQEGFALIDFLLLR